MKSVKNKLGISIKNLTCCCGGTKELPCLCMIKGNTCSRIAPLCLCFKLLNKQKKKKKK